MKHLKMLLVAAMSIITVTGFAQTEDGKKEKAPKQKTTKASYTCPMHPEVKSDKPGKCSRCGMALEKVKKEKPKTETAKLYSCPMHPTVTSDEPGKCTSCGMELTKQKDDHPNHQL